MAAVGTTHHVKIGNDYFLVRPGSYRKRGAPLFGARFATGDPDYNNLSFWQHWAQTCWIGGMGAETWQDDAMFDEGVGVDTSQHEVLVLARDLGPNSNRTTKKWTMEGGVNERAFVEFNNKLYCLSISATTNQNQLHRYNPGTDDWTHIRTFTELVRGYCAWSDKLWFGDGGSSFTYMNPDETFGTKAKPSGRTETPYVMFVFKDRMYVGFGKYLWRMKFDEAWDGSTAFYEAAGVNYFHAAELHQGFLYLASQNGKIVRTDGNVTVDIWQWDAGAVPISLRSYDGRLFVGCNEVTLDGAGREGVLYQFTGSAVTELKRWGRSGKLCTLGKLRVARRRLFYGASDLLGVQDGFGIAVYDSVEDSHHIFASNMDTVTYAAGTNAANFQVDDVVYWGGYMFCSVRGHGVFKTRLSWQDLSRGVATYDTTAAGASVGSLNGGWLRSSDFDAGTPGLNKLWRSITVHADVPHTSCSVYVDYSVDGGVTWAGAGAVTKESSATRYRKTFFLQNVVATRIMYRLTLRTSNTLYSPQVRGVVVSYLPSPEPGWQWEMTLAVSEEQELLDGTVASGINTNALLLALESAFRDHKLVGFTDIDGTAWTASGPGVLITDMIIDMRAPGPSSDGPREADVRITLVEGVETFA